MEVASQKNLDDTIQWTKFTNISWSPDESGFYYTGYKAPKQEGKKHQTQTYFSKVYFHRLGTPQSQDQIIYDDPNTKDAMFDLQVSDDGTHLILEISKGTDNRNQVFIRPRKSNQNHWTTLIGNWDAGYRYICTHEKQLVFLSTKDAPSGKVVSIDPQNPKTWTTFVPEKRDVLRKVSRTKTHLVLQYLNNAHSQIELLNLKNRKSSILQLPGIGSAWGTNTKKTSDEIFIAFSSFNQPTTIYHLDARNPQIRLWRKPNASFTPEDFVTEQVFYSSKDGTKIPMFISHHKSIEKDGTNPLYLFGYGGFNISMTPHFNPKYIAWMEMGGVVAIPNLRGGGEYGEDWHKAGTKTNKQNVFDDFIGAAEYLHQNLYSIPQKTAIVGRSNGGLLVAASLLQRPDLFGAVVAQVGVLDMLRFHKFTIGWAWTDDYGNPDNPIDFKHLLSYSPLHNIHNGVYYPPTLVTTADTDDRVVPSHSFKFIAALQHASAGLDPLLIRIETKSGHGSGTPTAKRIDKAADVFSFLTQNLHVDL